ncbi:MAG TPA: hypothetical protein VL443_01620 [Cyclobacteriaceae bacterium]|nr:hypothetical protein [Cyclobacteriaceae bacterium]
MKHIIKIFFSITVIISTCDLSWAQQYTPRSQGDVNMIRNSTLAVVLETVSEDVLKKLSSKPDEEKAYRNKTEGYNERIRQIITAEWSLSANVSFISHEESIRLISARDERYCLLDIGSNYAHEEYSPQPMRSSITCMQIRSAAHPFSALLYCALPDALYNTGELTYCVQQLKNQVLDYGKGIGSFSKYRKAIKARTPSLKNKTLLLCTDITKNAQKVDSSGRLKRIYPYAYEVVNDERLNELITNKDEHYAYALTVLNFKTSGGNPLLDYIIVDCKDGHSLFRTTKQGLVLGFVRRHFTMDHLKLAVRASKKKIKDSAQL